MFDLIVYVRECKNKKGEKFNAYDFYLVAPNGHKEKVCPNVYKDKGGKIRSNMNVLFAYAKRGA